MADDTKWPDDLNFCSEISATGVNTPFVVEKRLSLARLIPETGLSVVPKYEPLLHGQRPGGFIRPV